MAHGSVAGLLNGYLRQAAAVDFQYGAHDCGLFMADWILERTGTDPAKAFRGRYSSRIGFEAICPLGVLRAACRGAKAAGLALTSDPGAGDVGVLRMAWGHTGAIKTERGWMMLSDQGLAFVRDAKVVRAWRVECTG